jgi:hypothetical protein
MKHPFAAGETTGLVSVASVRRSLFSLGAYLLFEALY